MGRCTGHAFTKGARCKRRQKGNRCRAHRFQQLHPLRQGELNAPACAVCLEPVTTPKEKSTPENFDTVRTKCGHVFHHACLAEWLKTSPTCPMCRAPAHQTTFHLYCQEPLPACYALAPLPQVQALLGDARIPNVLNQLREGCSPVGWTTEPIWSSGEIFYSAVYRLIDSRGGTVYVDQYARQLLLSARLTHVNRFDVQVVPTLDDCVYLGAAPKLITLTPRSTMSRAHFRRCELWVYRIMAGMRHKHLDFCYMSQSNTLIFDLFGAALLLRHIMAHDLRYVLLAAMYVASRALQQTSCTLADFTVFAKIDDVRTTSNYVKLMERWLLENYFE